MISYLFEVSVCITAFYALYKLLLSRFTFYRFNRFYLLITLAASFIIPALSVKVQQKQVVQQSFTKPLQLKSTPVSVEEIDENTGAKTVTDWNAIVVKTYVFASAVFLGIFLWQLISLLISCCSKKQEQDGLLLIKKDKGQVNYSFFRYVFIGKNSIGNAAFPIFLKHEKFHADQWHSVDRLLISLGKIMLWFHPLVYLYSRELAMQHEFAADKFVSARCGKKTYAEALLQTAISQSRFFNLATAFAKKPLSIRIQKIFTKSTLNMKKSFYVSVIPVMAMLCWMYSFEPVFTTKNSAEKFTIVIDAGHGGNDNGAETNGIYEKDIVLDLSKLLADKLRKNNIEVILTRTDDKALLLKERVTNKSDFFLSLHANKNNATAEENGILMMVPTWKENEKPGSRMLQSANMSVAIYNSFKNNRGIGIDSSLHHNQRLFVLENARSPALLLELGYMSNPKDFKYITSKKGRDEIADALTKAIIQYRTNTAH